MVLWCLVTWVDRLELLGVGMIELFMYGKVVENGMLLEFHTMAEIIDAPICYGFESTCQESVIVCLHTIVGKKYQKYYANC